MAINPSQLVEDDDALATYELPDAKDIDDPYLKEVWEEVKRQLDSGEEDETEESQYTEIQSSNGLVVQFDETEAVKKLRDFIGRGVAAKIAIATQRIKEFKETSLDAQTVAGLIEREIRALEAPIASDLGRGGVYTHLKGLADVLSSLPKSPTSPVVPLGRPLEAPRIAAELKEVLGEGVDLPSLESALGVLERSPVAVGINYRDTAEKVRAGAFAITGELTDKAVIDVKELLSEAMREGQTKDEFIDNVLVKLGGDKLSPTHIENIIRTNQASIYSDARMEAMGHDLVTDAFPYVAIYATLDARVRPNHAAMERLGLDGTNIYRMDDPTFRKFRAPWDYNCRCTWNGITVEQAARKGVKEAVEWWDKAKSLAKTNNDSPYRYLSATKPSVPTFVTPPDFNPTPGFARQFDETRIMEIEPPKQTLVDAPRPLSEREKTAEIMNQTIAGIGEIFSKQPAPVFNISLPPSTVNVEAPTVNVAAPVVNVAAAKEPIIKLPKQAPPVVNVTVETPKPPEFDIEPERGADGKIIRYKRVPKEE